MACNDKNALFTSEQPKRYKLWSCQKMCDALHYLLDNIFIRFGLKLYRQIVGIPIGTNCAPLVADLFLFCYERDFMLSLSDNNQTDIIEAFNSTSRYLDDLLNIDNPWWSSRVNHRDYSCSSDCQRSSPVKQSTNRSHRYKTYRFSAIPSLHWRMTAYQLWSGHRFGLVSLVKPDMRNA